MSLINNINRKFQNYWAYEIDHTRESFFFSVSPIIKLLTTISFIIILNNYIKSQIIWVGISIIIILVDVILQINLRQFFKIEIFLGILYPLIVALPLLFITKGSPIWNFSLGSIQIIISQDGVDLGLNYFFRLNATITIIAFFLASTPFIHIIHALRQLHVPSFIVSMVMLTYRYFFFFFDNLVTILRADSTRHLQKMGFKPRFNHLSNLFGNLLLRSLHQGTAIHRAMLARGYTGELPVLGFSTNTKKTSIYITLMSCSFISAILLQICVLG